MGTKFIKLAIRTLLPRAIVFLLHAHVGVSRARPDSHANFSRQLGLATPLRRRHGRDFRWLNGLIMGAAARSLASSCSPGSRFFRMPSLSRKPSSSPSWITRAKRKALFAYVQLRCSAEEELVTSGHGVHEAMLAIQTAVAALVAPKVVVTGSYRSSELNQGGALLCARENIHSVTLLATV
jgi:hypothetical protein